MSVEANKRLIERLYRVGYNRQNIVVLTGLYAENASNHGVQIGRSGMANIFKALFALFPDLTYEVETCVAENDRVICKVMMRATHLGRTDKPDVYGGMLMGVEPTGKPVRVAQFHSFRISAGAITEHTAVRDDLGMVQQLGIVGRP